MNLSNFLKMEEGRLLKENRRQSRWELEARGVSNSNLAGEKKT